MRAPSPETLVEQQRRFAGHIRDPEATAAPGDVPDRRMAVYRELFFNNIEGVLADGMPVLRERLGEGCWMDLVRAFFAGHPSATPFLARLPGEFAAWLTAGNGPVDLPPWAAELADYEWRTLELVLADLPEGAPVDGGADLLGGVPVLSPRVRLCGYRYPVHRFGTEVPADAPPAEPTRLVLWRDAEGDVQALGLNPVSARLLELLAGGDDRPGRSLLTAIARELHHPDYEVVVAGGLALLEDLRARGVLLGARPSWQGDET